MSFIVNPTLIFSVKGEGRNKTLQFIFKFTIHPFKLSYNLINWYLYTPL